MMVDSELKAKKRPIQAWWPTNERALMNWGKRRIKALLVAILKVCVPMFCLLPFLQSKAFNLFVLSHSQPHKHTHTHTHTPPLFFISFCLNYHFGLFVSNCSPSTLDFDLSIMFLMVLFGNLDCVIWQIDTVNFLHHPIINSY